MILWESVMSCFCKKVFSITLTASYPHRALHPWPHCGNGFCQLPIFRLLSETCWKHPVCPFSIAFSVFLSQFFFPNCLSLQDDLSQAVTHFFSNCPNTPASVFRKYSVFKIFFNLSYQGADLCLPINPCLHGGTCYNALDTYICHCPPRYSGNNCTGV